MRKLIGLILGGAVILSLCACSFNVNTIKNADKYTAGNAEITGKVENLDIDWDSGKLNIIPGSGNTIILEESYEGELPEEKQMHWYLDGTTLRVVYDMSFGVSANTNKTLNVTVPENLIFNEVNFDVASADLNAEGLAATSADIDTASGDVNVSFTQSMKDVEIDTASGDVTIDTAQSLDQLDIDSASGEIHINAGDKINTVDIDTASGDVEAGFNKVPDSIKIDAASGNVTLRLPKNADMTLDIDTASGDFESELPFSIKSGDKYVIGAGTSSAKIDTASGDITIIKY